MATPIKNDSLLVLPTQNAGGSVQVPFNGLGSTLSLLEGQGVYITHDFRFGAHHHMPSDPLPISDLVGICDYLGLEFSLDDPKSRIVPLRDQDGNLLFSPVQLLDMLGKVESRKDSHYVWELSGDLLFLSTEDGRRQGEVGPFSLTDVEKEAQKLLRKARHWRTHHLEGILMSDWDTLANWEFDFPVMPPNIHIRSIGEEFDVTRFDVGARFAGEPISTWSSRGDYFQTELSCLHIGFSRVKRLRIEFTQHGSIQIRRTNFDTGTVSQTLYVAK